MSDRLKPRNGQISRAKRAHLLFVSTSRGYQLVERDGPPPAAFGDVTVPGHEGLFRVVKVADLAPSQRSARLRVRPADPSSSAAAATSDRRAALRRQPAGAVAIRTVRRDSSHRRQRACRTRAPRDPRRSDRTPERRCSPRGVLSRACRESRLRPASVRAARRARPARALPRAARRRLRAHRGHARAILWPEAARGGTPSPSRSQYATTSSSEPRAARLYWF